MYEGECTQIVPTTLGTHWGGGGGGGNPKLNQTAIFHAHGSSKVL